MSESVDPVFDRVVDKKRRKMEHEFDLAEKEWPSDKDLCRVLWKVSGLGEVSILRFTLLHAAGWDEGWAVMEWHRLPLKLRMDLDNLPKDMVMLLTNQDEARIKKINEALKVIYQIQHRR